MLKIWGDERGENGISKTYYFRWQCCDGQCPPCDKICGKMLSCQKHKCASPCHQGQCYPCELKAQLKCRYLHHCASYPLRLAQCTHDQTLLNPSSFFDRHVDAAIHPYPCPVAEKRKQNHQSVNFYAKFHRNVITRTSTNAT